MGIINTEVSQAVKDFELGVGGFYYSDLYRAERLKALAEAFYQQLRADDPSVAEEFEEYRKAQGLGIDRVKESDLLIRVAHHQEHEKDGGEEEIGQETHCGKVLREDDLEVRHGRRHQRLRLLLQHFRRNGHRAKRRRDSNRDLIERTN